MSKYVQLDDHFSLNIEKIVSMWFGEVDTHRLYIKTTNGFTWSTTDQARIQEFCDEFDKLHKEA